MLVEYVFLTFLLQTIHMMGEIMSSGNTIKVTIKQHNVVTQKTFLCLLRFSLPQSVFLILTIAIIVKTRSTIENMLASIMAAVQI